jgi:aspartyl/asparaginyl beta-hydroxylase (cupin superfamily)
MAIPFAGSCRLKLQIKKPQAVSVFACGFKKWFI